MIANATAHRRANAFAQALDARARQPEEGDEGTAAEPGAEERAPDGGAADHRTGGQHGGPGHDRMLAIAQGLGRLPAPELDPEVKTVQRAQLVSAAETAFAGGTLDPEKVRLPRQRDRRQHAHRPGAAERLRGFRPRSRWGRRLAASGLAMATAAGGLGGVAAASTDALPGDNLYGLKRGIEDLRLNMADGDTDRGRVLLGMASTRLKEARRLLERSRSGPLDEEHAKEVRRTLSGIQQEASEGHRLLSKAYRTSGSLDSIGALASFSEQQGWRWGQLSERLPGEFARDRDRVSSVFDAIEREVVPLRPLLPEPGHGPLHPSAPQDSGPGASGAPDRPGSSAPGRDPESSQRPESEPGEGRSGAPGASRAPAPEDEEPPRDSSSEEEPETSGSEPPADENDSEDDPDAEVTLPPLLPGLLPGVDLDTGG